MRRKKKIKENKKEKGLPIIVIHIGIREEDRQAPYQKEEDKKNLKKKDKTYKNPSQLTLTQNANGTFRC